MATHNGISLGLSADTLAKTALISNASRGLKAYRIKSSVTRILCSGRYTTNDRAWHHAIQVALPLAGPAFGLVALIAISLTQG